MVPCPHCGKPIEVGPRAEVGWWKYDPGGTPVSLGCGTLLLIAIIVIIFSGGGSDGEALEALEQHMQVLEDKIDNLETKLSNDMEQRAAER